MKEINKMDKEKRAALKDWLYIITIIIGAISWYITSSNNNAIFINTVEQHTLELEKLNNKMDKQLELNVKIRWYLIHCNNYNK